jgi:hypothetical protein
VYTMENKTAAETEYTIKRDLALALNCGPLVDAEP